MRDVYVCPTAGAVLKEKLKLFVETSCDEPPKVEPLGLTGIESLAFGLGYEIVFDKAAVERVHVDACELQGCEHARRHHIVVRCWTSTRMTFGLSFGKVGLGFTLSDRPAREDVEIATPCECCLEDPTSPPFGTGLDFADQRAGPSNLSEISTWVVFTSLFALAYQFPDQGLKLLGGLAAASAVVALLVYFGRGNMGGPRASPTARSEGRLIGPEPQ